MSRFVMHSPMQSWTRGAYPLSPFVEITLDDAGLLRQAGSRLVLTDQLMTAVEVDDAIDNLVRELERVRSEAKEELRRHLRTQPGAADPAVVAKGVVEPARLASADKVEAVRIVSTEVRKTEKASKSPPAPSAARKQPAAKAK